MYMYIYIYNCCRAYLHAYSAHSLKEIYDVHKLDLQAVARSFGFTNPPKVRRPVMQTQRCNGHMSCNATWLRRIRRRCVPVE